MRASRRCRCDWRGLLAVGILWDLALAGRFLVVLSVARSGGADPAAGAAGDADDVKCLAGAVSFFRNGGGCGACPVCGALAGFARLAAGREPAGNWFDSYRGSVRVLLLSSGNVTISAWCCEAYGARGLCEDVGPLSGSLSRGVPTIY